jgi:hypothetical protein
MELKNLSLAGSLCLLALGLFANAGVDWASATQKTAHADDLKTKRHQAVADVPVSRSDEGGAEMVAGSQCVIEGEPLNWFGAIRRMPSCLYPSDFWRVEYFQADVDGDGRFESFKASGSALIPSYPGEYVESSMFRVIRTRFEDGEVVVERSSIIQREWLAAWVQENLALTSAHLSWSPGSGWHDIDDDGDLDLIVSVATNTGEVFIWLENTGFEKQTYAAGDINQDGEVDGVDISILLSDWTY